MTDFDDVDAKLDQLQDELNSVSRKLDLLLRAQGVRVPQECVQQCGCDSEEMPEFAKDLPTDQQLLKMVDELVMGTVEAK